MYNCTKIFSLFFLLLVFILSCTTLINNKENKLIWNSIKIYSLDTKWRLESKNEKTIIFQCMYGDDKATIYLEYIKTPVNKLLSIDNYLKKLMVPYHSMYDDISIQKILINNDRSYKIIHSINNDNRKLITIIVPKRSDFVTIVFSASKSTFNEIVKDFEKFITNSEFGEHS